MNILLFMTAGMSLAAWRDSGTLNRELALYERLSRLGATVGIVSYGGKEDQDIARLYPWLKVYCNAQGLPPDRYARLLPLLHAFPLLRADIIKSNQISGADAALRCARIWNKPFIARCGYMWSEFTRSICSETAQKIGQLECHLFSQAHHCIVTTEAMRESILARTSVSKQKISVFPNYVPDYLFDSPLCEVSQDTTPCICQLGRLSKQKNIPSLLQACQGLPVTLRLLGDGEERFALQTLADELGVTLEMPGQVPHENLDKALDAATVCVLVSHYEGHPKALLEYMARGRPVLGTRVPGIAEIIRHEHNGLLCAPDPSSIREGLQRLLNDPDLRKRLGEQARKDARAFSLQATAEHEISLYSRISKQHTGASLPCAVRHGFHFAARVADKALRTLAARALDTLTAKIANSPRMARRLRPLLALPQSLAPETPMPPSSAGCGIEDAVRALADSCAKLPPAEALRQVFTLENRLYVMAGNLAVAYDGGVHTKHRHTRYHSFFIDRLSAEERVLDIGCGNGFLAYDMAMQAGAFVTGIDFNSDSIALAQERFQHERASFICGDALKDLPEGCYDVVVLSNVLEHLPERAAFLQKVQRRLAPKRYLIRVPLFERDWRVPLKRELGMEWRLDTTHETEYTQESFLQEIHDAGLEVNHIEFRWGEIWCELRPAAFSDKEATS